MNGILGFLSSDGQAVDQDTLKDMAQGMAFGGQYQAFLWQNEQIGLGVLSTQDKPIPFWRPVERLALAVQARLDNRDELIAYLRLPDPDVDDDEIIAQAYLRWGDACVHHLLGDWAFAIWDARERKLLLARDPCGISTFYYARCANGFAFATSVKGILGLPQLKLLLNRTTMARFLVMWIGGDDGSQTFYEGIERLPAAHTLTITTGKMDKRRYWTPEAPPPLRLSSDAEYLEAFMDVYSTAVRCRLYTHSRHPALQRSQAGATLSSGLDSSSVCALAARELRASGRRLAAFTAVPVYPTDKIPLAGRYGDEMPMVELTRQYLGNLDVTYIRAENFGPLAGLARGLEVHDAPIQNAGNLYWLHALLNEARRQDLKALLIGQIGNWTVSWAGSAENLWPLVFRGQWPTLQWKYERLALSPWQMIKRHFVRPLVMNGRQLINKYSGYNPDPWRLSPINPRWAQELDLAQKMRTAENSQNRTPVANDDSMHLWLLSIAGSAGAIWAESGAAYGLEIRDPTADKRLIEFCLSVPNEQFQWHGQDRALIRRAMKGLLPDAVRLNPQRGLQAADIHRLLQTETCAVKAALGRLQGSSLARQILDLPKMTQVLNSLRQDEIGSTIPRCRMVLLRGLMAGMFLERFDDSAA